jgi:hypothetical protein
MNRMVFALAALFLGAPILAARAADVRIHSPERHQTWAYSDTTWKRLLYDPKSGRFFASVLFTNQWYVLRGERVERETFLFTFPGVKYDPKARLFYAHAGGKRVPIARFEDETINTSIVPLPTTQVYINKSASGLVYLTLAASTDPSAAKSRTWIDR